MSSLSPFGVTIEPLEEACLIRASGELDRSTADRLDSVSFIDSAGLRVLLRSARAVDTHHWAWFIVRASSAVWRLVEVSGTTSRLPLGAPPESTERISTFTTAARRLAG